MLNFLQYNISITHPGTLQKEEIFANAFAKKKNCRRRLKCGTCNEIKKETEKQVYLKKTEKNQLSFRPALF